MNGTAFLPGKKNGEDSPWEPAGLLDFCVKTNAKIPIMGLLAAKAAGVYKVEFCDKSQNSLYRKAKARQSPKGLSLRRVLPAVIAAAAAAAVPVGFIHRLVYLDGAPVKVGAVGSAYGGLRFRVGAHFHKGETFGCTGIPIGNDFDRFYRTRGGEKSAKIIFVGVVGKITYIQFFSHGASFARIFPGL
jgi:hypothetical protein